MLGVYTITSFAVGLGLGYLLRKNYFLIYSLVSRQPKIKIDKKDDSITNNTSNVNLNFNSHQFISNCKF